MRDSKPKKADGGEDKKTAGTKQNNDTPRRNTNNKDNKNETKIRIDDGFNCISV